MTLADKRQERASALLEYEEARQQLELLRSKARAISDDLSEMACWLSEAKDVQHGPALSRQRLRDKKIENDQARYRAALDFDALVSLREEIKRLRARVDELAARNQNLWA